MAAADPISAIANAVGSIVAGVTGAITASTQKKQSEAELQYEATSFKWFYKADESGSTTNQIILILLFSVIVLLIIAIIFKKPNRNGGINS